MTTTRPILLAATVLVLASQAAAGPKPAGAVPSDAAQRSWTFRLSAPLYAENFPIPGRAGAIRFRSADDCENFGEVLIEGLNHRFEDTAWAESVSGNCTYLGKVAITFHGGTPAPRADAETPALVPGWRLILEDESVWGNMVFPEESLCRAYGRFALSIEAEAAAGEIPSSGRCIDQAGFEDHDIAPVWQDLQDARRAPAGTP